MESASKISNPRHLFPICEQDTIILVPSHNDPDNPDDDTPGNIYELARILSILDYNAKILSCDKYNESSPWIVKFAQWIPRSMFGYFKTPFAVTKLFFIASQILMYKKTCKAIIVVVEELTYIIPLLKILGDIKIMYFEDVLKNIPIVDKVDNYRQRNRRHQLYYLKYVNKVVVSCRTSKLILENELLNINKRPILLYPNIETPEFLDERYIPAANILNVLDHDSIVILTFGDYVPENNFDLAIDSFKRLQKKFKNHRYLNDHIYLLICGTCKNRKQLHYMQQLMNARKNSKNVIFIRNMPYTFRKALLKIARCVIFPSVIYNHDQMVLMQCLMMGKIVIATKCDVTDDLMQHESNGYICNATVNDFVSYMAKIITDPFAHKSLESTIKSVFSDYYGEGQYITAVKSIFESLDISGEIPESEQMLCDLSVMGNSYSIKDMHKNIWASKTEDGTRKDESVELVPIPQITPYPIEGGRENIFGFRSAKYQFMDETGWSSSTPVKKLSNWAQLLLSTQNFASGNDEDFRGLPSFSKKESNILSPIYSVKQKSLYVPKRKDEKEYDIFEDSLNQTTTVSQGEPDNLPNYFTPSFGASSSTKSTLYAITENNSGESCSYEDSLNQSSFKITQAADISNVKIGGWTCCRVEEIKKLAAEIGGLKLLEEESDEVICEDSAPSGDISSSEPYILLKPGEVKAYKAALSDVLGKINLDTRKEYSSKLHEAEDKEANNTDDIFEDSWADDDTVINEENSTKQDEHENGKKDSEIFKDSLENTDADSVTPKVEEIEKENIKDNQESSGESIHQYSKTSEDYSPNKSFSTEEEKNYDTVEKSNPTQVNTSNQIEVEIEEGFENVPLKSQENDEPVVYDPEHLDQTTDTGNDQAIQDCNDSEDDTWNFQRSRSYSVPRYWRPLEKRFDD